METPIVREAIRRLRATGGGEFAREHHWYNILTMMPMSGRVCWRTQVRLGLIPYYMFVAA